MAGEFSTAGIKLYYKIDAVPNDTASNIPTTGFTRIPGVKAISSFNDSPNMLDVTDLSDKRRRNIAGLIETSDVKTITANGSTDGTDGENAGFEGVWEELVDEYAKDTGIKGGTKTCWFEVEIPNHKSYYFTGEPLALQLPELAVGDVYEVEAYVSPSYVPGFAAKSTKTISDKEDDE